ncbi:MAG: hypothetical protein ACTSW3_05645 [Promethearchaeota archaeon]
MEKIFKKLKETIENLEEVKICPHYFEGSKNLLVYGDVSFITYGGLVIFKKNNKYFVLKFDNVSDSITDNLKIDENFIGIYKTYFVEVDSLINEIRDAVEFAEEKKIMEILGIDKKKISVMDLLALYDYYILTLTSLEYALKTDDEIEEEIKEFINNNL